MQKDYQELFKKINITISDDKLIRNAFVHRSYLNEHKDYDLASNEKLEFLGDSVLSLITSIYLYKNFPELGEGAYTDIKASVVRMESLAEAANGLRLGQHLLLSNGEEANEGRKNTNILADCFEALLAVIFLHHGFESAYEFVVKFLFIDKVNHIVQNKLYLSPKSHLQEICQERYKMLPIYKLVSEDGPEHSKEFTVEVEIDAKISGVSKGKSKKQAEEGAARQALEKIMSE
jgi:ribonuclease III